MTKRDLRQDVPSNTQRTLKRQRTEQLPRGDGSHELEPSSASQQTDRTANARTEPKSRGTEIAGALFRLPEPKTSFEEDDIRANTPPYNSGFIRSLEVRGRNKTTAIRTVTQRSAEYGEKCEERIPRRPMPCNKDTLPRSGTNNGVRVGSGDCGSVQNETAEAALASFQNDVSIDAFQPATAENDLGSRNNPFSITLTTTNPISNMDLQVSQRLQWFIDQGILEDGDIDSRTHHYLAKLPVDRALFGLDELTRCDFRTVRKRRAYILGVLRRSCSTAKPITTHGNVLVPDDALIHLPDTVAAALRQVFYSGNCHPSDFDDRAMDELTRLPEDLALRALQCFVQNPREPIRNPSAYFVGIVKQVERQVMRDHISGSTESPSGANTSAHQTLFSYSTESFMSDLRRHRAIDSRAVHALRSLPEAEVINILNYINEHRDLRNPSAYVMSRCRALNRASSSGH